MEIYVRTYVSRWSCSWIACYIVSLWTVHSWVTYIRICIRELVLVHGDLRTSRHVNICECSQTIYECLRTTYVFVNIRDMLANLLDPFMKFHVFLQSTMYKLKHWRYLYLHIIMNLQSYRGFYCHVSSFTKFVLRELTGDVHTHNERVFASDLLLTSSNTSSICCGLDSSWRVK